MEKLRKTAADNGIVITNAQMEQLRGYAALLAEWNEKVNLTAITLPSEVEEKHFIDCMIPAALPLLHGNLVDVGSGAGFPGMVIKILNPRLKVSLMEPTGKRTAFLSMLAGRLGVEVTVIKERAEEAARKKWRESFDVAIARAVAALPVLYEYCLPLVRRGGLFIAMKGVVANEVQLAEKARSALGGAMPRVEEYALPGGARRSLVLVEKEGSTPERYPRPGGVISKRLL